MIWSKKRFQHAIELLPHVFKEVAPFLLPLSATLWGLEFYVAWLNKARFDDPYNSSMALMMVVGLTGVILQSLISVFWILAVSGSTRRQSLNGQGPAAVTFAFQHFHQVLIESIRALISTGLYTLCFLLPGLVRWVQLVFTPLIAAFDPDYAKGKKDALQASRHLAKGAAIPLLFLLIVQSSLPFAFEEMAKSQGTPWPLTLLFYGIAWLCSLYLSIYLVLTFFARSGFKAGTH